MTAVGSDDQRDLIPRWRPVAPTWRSGELDPLRTAAGSLTSPPTTEDSSAAFAEHPGHFTAGELLAQYSVTGVAPRELAAARQFVIGHSATAPRALLGMVSGAGEPLSDATLAASPLSERDMRERVGAMRAIVRSQPRNALRWVDLALAHVNLGNHGSARREMLVALALEPDHRFVLRSAARLFVALDEADVAHDFLVRSTSLNTDPWVQAAEISVSEKLGVRSWTRARHIRDQLEAPKWALRHFSELAAEAATRELRNGSTRSAKKMMAVALADPTDNALAQAVWATGVGLSGADLEARLAMPRGFEARARAMHARADHHGAVSEARKWQNDEPFAAEPAEFISYVAATFLDDPAPGIDPTRKALIANPANALLRNNLAFMLASSDRPAEAAKVLDELRGSAEEMRPVVLATRGLVALRSGDRPQGESLYRDAIDKFRARGERDLALRAEIYLAREIFRMQRREGEAMLASLLGSLPGDASQDTRAIANLVLRVLHIRP
jgi:hypothetical protein